MSKTIQHNQNMLCFLQKPKLQKRRILVNEYLQSGPDLLYVNNIVHKQIGSNNFF